MYVRWMVPATQMHCAPQPQTQDATVTPAADVLDDGDNYQVILELPGARKEDLTLTLDQGVMVVRAARSGHEGSAKLVHDGRRAAYAFERRFTLGEGVDVQQVTAKLENGLLYVTLPRRAEEKRRRIEVVDVGTTTV
jgi:HSP20 family protein